MSSASNNQLTIFVAVVIGAISGFAFNRSSDEESSEKSSQVEAAEGDSEGEDAAEGTRGTRGSGSRSSRSEDASRDPRLVGNWRYTETYASDGISMVFDQFMTIEADGTMTVRDGAAAGGGGDFTFDEPPSDESMTCEWRTNGNMIEVRGEGSDWSPLAEYQVDANNLMTVTNGDRQIWERI